MSLISAKETERVESQTRPSAEIVTIARPSRGSPRSPQSEIAGDPENENSLELTEINLQSDLIAATSDQTVPPQLEEPLGEGDPFLQP